MKSLVLAEKPSVGKELGRVLGLSSVGKYMEGPSYIVTWALGHLVTLCPPDHYKEEYKRWTLRSLPMLPDTLETQVIEKTAEQFNIVKSLLDRADVGEVIIATDAGREGELVARWILKQAGCTKPAKRLWISSQTDMAIKEGFANLKDASCYDSLYAAAESRSFADWYIGYNVSRAMSLHFDTRLSAGRVQTPTLSLICNREDEIESFAGKFYWTLKADFGIFKASRYSADNTVKIETEEEALALQKKLTGAEGTVVRVSEVAKEEKPPLAYDLTELQRDANRLLGFSAKETLDTLQRLYEVHKIVTYPRTDSRYITEDIVPTFPQRFIALLSTPFAPLVTSYMKDGIRKDLSGLVNNSMVSDHHALLPTEQKVDLSRLTEQERALWELIIIRFLETLSADYEYKTTTVESVVEGEKFLSRLTLPVKQGWRSVASAVGKKSAVEETDPDTSEFGLTMLKEGTALKVKDVVLKRNATLAPSRYTEADLLYAMEHAGKFVEDKELKKRLENGLGTPATRADIIEKLIQNGCMERVDKYLVPTAKGRELVRLVPKQLKSATLTGMWEKRLFEISNGNEDRSLFIKDIKNNTTELVNEVLANIQRYNPDLEGDVNKKCPHCGWSMVTVFDEFEREHHVCQRFSCGYEELLAKRKVSSGEVVEKKVVATVDGKKVIMKKPVVQDKWETVLEVVKPSHFRPRTEKTFDHPKKSFTGSNRPDFSSSSNDFSGGTFADFLRASEERKKRDEEKRHRK